MNFVESSFSLTILGLCYSMSRGDSIGSRAIEISSTNVKWPAQGFTHKKEASLLQRKGLSLPYHSKLLEFLSQTHTSMLLLWRITMKTTLNFFAQSTTDPNPCSTKVRTQCWTGVKAKACRSWYTISSMLSNSLSDPCHLKWGPGRTLIHDGVTQRWEKLLYFRIIVCVNTT